MSEKNELKIGQVAKGAGVNIQTIRYYERIGILKPLHRRDSGYRIYDKSAVQIIRFIKHAQELGFPLEEIQALLKLKSTNSSKCDNVQKRALAHLKEVKAKIARLERMKGALEELIERCCHRMVDSECPILESLEKE